MQLLFIWFPHKEKLSGVAYVASVYQLDIYTIEERLARKKRVRVPFLIDSSAHPSGSLGMTERWWAALGMTQGKNEG
jgi:hypothetical protein